MIPFGSCVHLWRRHRRLSQAELAQKAGVPRPNLSDIERGEREVSLRTLRALAMALDIRPGLLADGIGPDSSEPLVLSRDRLERIAHAVAEGKTLSDSRERELAEKAALLTAPKLRASAGAKHPLLPRQKGRAQRAWLSVGVNYRPGEIQSLVERISEKAASYRGPVKDKGRP